MVARHFYRDDDDSMVEILTVPREGWEVKEGAEEGSSESSTIAIPDPEMVLDFLPYRRWEVYEDTSEDENDLIYCGFVLSTETGREGGDLFEATGRVITVTVVDSNSLFERRVMVGETDRPDETDVERVTWVAESEEMGYFVDLAYLFAGGTEDMEARDVAGQTPKQLFDECAQDTDKNYWIGGTNTIEDAEAGDDAELFLWYGKSSRDDYASPLSLSNDPADLIEADLADGSSLVWPVHGDAKLRRTGERIYSGVLVEYEGGRKYRKNPTTEATFALSGRDLVHPAPEIKTATRAGRRADKLLARLNEPDVVFIGTVRLPAAKASQFRAGMWTAIKQVHIPELAEFTACRILNASIKPVQAGRYYDITIEAEPIAAVVALSCSTSVSTSEDHVSTGTGTSPSDTITPTVDSTVLAFLLGMNSNTPSATDMTAISGYTDIFDIADAHRSTYRIASKAVSGGVGSTAAATFTGGFGGKDVWIATQVALPGSWTLVQQKDASAVGTAQEAVFDSTPVTGNLIVMFCHAEVTNAGVITPGGSTGPSDGWTLIGADTHTKYPGEPDSEWVATAVYARCMADDDGSVYGFTGEGNSNSVWLGELGL